LQQHFIGRKKLDKCCTLGEETELMDSFCLLWSYSTLKVLLSTML